MKLLLCHDKLVETVYSPHFTDEEFCCPCCKKIGDGNLVTHIHPRLLFRLECMRSYFNDRSIVITSGYRCEKYNSKLKGSSPTSKHMDGKAADLYIKGVSTDEIIQYWRTHVPSGYAYTNNSNMKGVVHVQIQ